MAVSLLSQGVGLLPRFRKLFLGPNLDLCLLFYDMYYVSCFDVVAVVIVVN